MISGANAIQIAWNTLIEEIATRPKPPPRADSIKRASSSWSELISEHVLTSAIVIPGVGVPHIKPSENPGRNARDADISATSLAVAAAVRPSASSSTWPTLLASAEVGATTAAPPRPPPLLSTAALPISPAPRRMLLPIPAFSMSLAGAA